ncbi:MAG: hypothetical protein V7752_21270 [Halopseudomonas sp.]
MTDGRIRAGIGHTDHIIEVTTAIRGIVVRAIDQQDQIGIVIGNRAEPNTSEEMRENTGKKGRIAVRLNPTAPVIAAVVDRVQSTVIDL